MNLLIFGLGYTGRAIAKAAVAAGFAVTATSRAPHNQAEPGVRMIHFGSAGGAVANATHILSTAAPDDHGDPVLARYGHDIGAAPNLRWIGYLSTTGVYGDHGGVWVDEDTIPTPGSDRTRRRVAAERAWAEFPVTVDIFRLAGIYGPGRSMFDDLRTGQGRRVIKPGHLFGRIHRDDITQAVLTAMRRTAPPGVNIYNLVDDEPAASADVVVEAARLLGMEPPPPVEFAVAWAKMSPMAKTFWAENRKVSAAKTKAALGLTWKYPSYREGLRAILREEAVQRPA
jgi:nucleoside-diphosphate-sugar epimerase